MTMVYQASRYKDPVYMPGRTERETRRLILAAEILNPFTRRMLQDAGLQAGMRVLDIGTGAGDVALVAAELVGPGGRVVGVDAIPQILTTGLRPRPGGGSGQRLLRRWGLPRSHPGQHL
jgi:protein-L-isoaspartate O-methyltransferase